MKSIIDMRPVYHRIEDRIRAHVLLCWLALLLIRIAETRTGQTWTVIRDELQRLHLGTFTGPAGSFRQRTELTTGQKKILTALGLPEPRRVFEAAQRRPDQHEHPGLVTRPVTGPISISPAQAAFSPTSSHRTCGTPVLGAQKFALA